MKKFKIYLLIIFVSALGTQLMAQQGQLIIENIPAPSLESSLFDNDSEQRIAVYLPPSYASTYNRYPVIYFLPGYSSPIDYFLYGTFQNFRLNISMDNLINQGLIEEMIVVLVNGQTFMWGSFYVNSDVRGNWEDFVIHDVINHIDSSYRTLPRSSSRGIGGHSMGGYAALNLAMLNPDILGVTYSLSPGLFDENGLAASYPFITDSVINEYLIKQDELDAMSQEDAHTYFLSFMDSLVDKYSYETIFIYSYGAAFAPNPNRNAPYIDYPYYVSGEDTLVDSIIWATWDYGFGGWPQKLDLYLDNLLDLDSITIDFGLHDEVVWIPDGCVYVSQLLVDAGVSHQLLSFNGGHSNEVRNRLEDYMFPYFSNTLNRYCCLLRGDVAEPLDGIILIEDLTFLVDYLFRSGIAPTCLEAGDCAMPLDGNIYVNDLTYLIDYLFNNGTAPPSC